MTADQQDVKLFVYGTLKRGHRNHYLIERASYLGTAKSGESFMLVAGHIPYMYRENGVGSRTSGEIYAVSPDLLNFLDRLEGHPHWYRRETIATIEDGSKERSTAFAYLYQQTPSNDCIALDGIYAE